MILRYLTFFGCIIGVYRYLLLRSGAEAPRVFFAPGQNLATENPGLHADNAVSGFRFRKSIGHVGTQSLQRNPPLAIPFTARDFRATEASCDVNLHALRAHSHRT